jgi:predicted DNA-binding protein with PD1-like motif
MKSKLIWKDRDERTFALVLEPGEDALACITQFAASTGIATASINGVGDFSRVVMGVYDLRRQRYRAAALTEPCEALGLRGDIAQASGGGPSVHLHAVLEQPGDDTRGGHLLSARVGASMEVILVEAPVRQRRLERTKAAFTLIEGRLSRTA